MTLGKLIVFSAPSGSGKTSIVQYLLKHPELALEFSVSATSRDKRGKEQDGIDYHFISKEQFNKYIDNNAFAEWEEVYKDIYYGTLKSEIERIRKKGKNVIFDIDVIGGLNIKKLYPDDTLAIFVKPPSVEELKKRLDYRKTDSKEKIKERLDKAAQELTYQDQFDIILINDSLKKAQKEAYKLILSFLKKKP